MSRSPALLKVIIRGPDREPHVSLPLQRRAVLPRPNMKIRHAPAEFLVREVAPRNCLNLDKRCRRRTLRRLRSTRVQHSSARALVISLFFDGISQIVMRSLETEHDETFGSVILPLGGWSLLRLRWRPPFNQNTMTRRMPRRWRLPPRRRRSGSASSRPALRD